MLPEIIRNREIRLAQRSQGMPTGENDNARKPAFWYLNQRTKVCCN